MQINKNSVQKILGISWKKLSLILLLTIILTIVSTHLSYEFSRKQRASCPFLTDKGAINIGKCLNQPIETIYGFPLKHLKNTDGIDIHYTEINYFKLSMNVVFWFLISGLIIYLTTFISRALMIKSWYIVLPGIILLIIFSLIWLGEMFTFFPTALALLSLFLLKSKKNKTGGAIISIFTGLIIFFQNTRYEPINFALIFFAYFPALTLLTAGIHYFWKKE